MSTATTTSHAQREMWREGITMALYLSLSLLAVIVATPDFTAETRSEVALTMALTALGLLVAHLLAFAISSRLVNKGEFDDEARRVVGAQIGAGLAVAALATLPTLLLDPSYSQTVVEFLLLAFVAGVGYLAARQADVSRGRALAYMAFVVVLALGVLAIKGLVGH